MLPAAEEEERRGGTEIEDVEDMADEEGLLAACRTEGEARLLPEELAGGDKAAADVEEGTEGEKIAEEEEPGGEEAERQQQTERRQVDSARRKT